MERIPSELFNFIFKDFTFQELIGLKTVCKKWNSLITQIKPEELIVIESGSGTSNNWYHSLKPIDLKNVILCQDFNFIDNPTFINHLSNLKLFRAPVGENDLEKLNVLSTLEQLSVDNYLRLTKETNLTLRLPNLKILQIYTSMSSEGKLTIDAPNLEILKAHQLFSLNFVHPHTLKEIEIDANENDDDTETFESLEAFTGLEVFRTDDMLANKLIEHTHKSLKRAHFYSDFIQRGVNGIQEDYVTQEFFDKMIEDRSKFGRSDLKLYFNGVELISERMFGTYAFQYLGGLSDFICYQDQYEEDPHWFTFVSFGEYANANKKGKIPTFFKKFKNIKRTYICREKADQSEVIEFLKNCPNMSSLSLSYNPKLNQDFYDQIPDLCPLISSLCFTQGEGNEIEMNYDFVLKLKFLRSFSTTDELSKEFVKNLFIKTKFLNILGCGVKCGSEKGSQMVKIKKLTKNSFGLTQYERERWLHLNIDELANLYEDLKQNDYDSKLYLDKIKKSKEKYSYYAFYGTDYFADENSAKENEEEKDEDGSNDEDENSVKENEEEKDEIDWGGGWEDNHEISVEDNEKEKDEQDRIVEDESKKNNESDSEKNKEEIK